MNKLFSLLIFTLLPLWLAAQISLTIPQIQGAGNSSTYIAQQVKTSGIVTAKYIGAGKINGFFMQDPVGDNTPLTSDGIFVYNTSDNVSIGDKVEITATVTEYYNKTQLSNIVNISTISTNNSITPTKVVYNADTFNWEQYEGMLLEFDQTLYVTGNYNLKLSGQLLLSPFIRYIPTNKGVPASAEYRENVNLNSKSQILLDDGIVSTNYSPIFFADENGTRRTGERIDNLIAVVDQTSSGYSIYPVSKPSFYGNPRPTTPTNLGDYNLKVCGFNLEYYLTTNYGQGFGPNNESEAAKQHIKIMEALLAIDADIYGLIEIEQGQNALIKLTNSLNAATNSNRYSYIDDGGTIYGTYTKVGYIYRNDKFAPYLDLKSNNTPSPLHRKKAQAFTLKSNNERFIFSLNHFKSKSGCSTASGADADKGDGQSCYNATRVAESNSTLNFLNTCQNYYDDTDVLIMGDLNAYAKEDPITALINGGYTDLHQVFSGDSAYSYLYQGQAGYLDHALASSSLKNQITGTQIFHINSDEPTMFEYGSTNYQPNMYRCSDHDPVVVGIHLGDSNGFENHTESAIFIQPTLIENSFNILNAINGFMEIYDIQGNKLLSKTIDSNSFETNIHSLTSGIYIVKVYANNKIERSRIIKK